MYRRIHPIRDDDAVGKFGEGVTETGSQLSIDDQPGALGTAVLTVDDVLCLVAIVCEIYDVEFLTVPDLAHGFPHYLTRGFSLGRVNEVSSVVTIPGNWRALYWKLATLVASDFWGRHVSLPLRI